MFDLIFFLIGNDNSISLIILNNINCTTILSFIKKKKSTHTISLSTFCYFLKKKKKRELFKVKLTKQIQIWFMIEKNDFFIY
jgi:hypothetical protein